jgi:hypothetical protein
MEEGSEGEEGPEEACVWEGGGRETGSVFAAHMYSERLLTRLHRQVVAV